MQAPAATTASTQTRHVGLRTRFVDEDKPRGLEAALAALPAPPRLEDVGAVLLAGTERLFLYVSPIFTKVR